MSTRTVESDWCAKHSLLFLLRLRLGLWQMVQIPVDSQHQPEVSSMSPTSLFGLSAVKVVPQCDD